MSNVVRARFAQHSRSEIELHNLVATRRPSFSPGGGGWPADLALTLPVDSLGESTEVQIGSDDVKMRVEIGRAFWRELCSAWAGDEALEELPPRLAEAVRATALAPLLDWLGDLTGMAMELRGTEDIVPEAAARLALRRRGDDDAATGMTMALLLLDAGATELMREALERLPAMESAAETSGLELPFQLVAGRARLTVGELRELASGDIVMVTNGVGPSGSGVLLLQKGRPVAVARLDGRRATIERLLESSMSEIDRSEWDGARDESADDTDTSLLVDDDEARADGGSVAPRAAEDSAFEGSQAASERLDPDDLDIDLTFDLGRVSLPLADLSQIQAGYTFELDMPAAGQVRILSGSKVIGQGELVQIDDRLGVRVTKLWKRPGE